MNYQKIHDSILCRAQTRNTNSYDNYESHHILPKCEGGDPLGNQVLLTQKEHRIVHKLRFKITGVLGNLLAYNLLKYGRSVLSENHELISSAGGKAHHMKYRSHNPAQYKIRQSTSGIIGGNKCKERKLGFLALSKSVMDQHRMRGRQTLIQNKIGMFADEFREQHKKNLQKRVNTSHGVFESMADAAKFHNVSCGTITYRVKSNSESWKEWYYLNGVCYEFA